MPLLEIRTFPTPRTRDEIVLPVVVQVAEARAFGPELIAQLDPFESVDFFGGNGTHDKRSTGRHSDELEEAFHKSVSWRRNGLFRHSAGAARGNPAPKRAVSLSLETEGLSLRLGAFNARGLGQGMWLAIRRRQVACGKAVTSHRTPNCGASAPGHLVPEPLCPRTNSGRVWC